MTKPNDPFEVSWFGQSWYSDMCFSQPKIDTPVGQECSHCGEKIEAGDAGMRYSNGPVAHRECFMRQVSGSLAHILRRCSCYVPGSIESDPPGLTKRQAAFVAVSVWRAQDRSLYDVARETCHSFGMPWTDPRTGEIFEPPKK